MRRCKRQRPNNCSKYYAILVCTLSVFTNKGTKIYPRLSMWTFCRSKDTAKAFCRSKDTAKTFCRSKDTAKALMTSLSKTKKPPFSGWLLS